MTPSAATDGRRQTGGGSLLPWALIFLATLAAYFPALKGGFIWDDDAHVTPPGLRALSGLGRIWTELGATQQYYPVLHSAFWLEHRLWGDSAFCYHLLNVLLHAAAACLFGALLSRLNPNRVWPWFAAALFALHPVGVESVAWISEQKNTLSTAFYLLAALAFLRWRAPGPARGGAYFAATGFFLLALLSKSVTATLPAALLVVLWWKNGRLDWKRDILPLLPWFVLALAAGLVTAWVERTYIGARGAHFELSFGQKLLLAGRIVWFYLAKLAWPSGLIFVYPRWAVADWPLWRAVFPLGVLLILAAAWLARRQSRAPLAGLLFFVGSLFPAVGFFNVYPFVFSYVADHFQYLASLGIFALAGGGGALALGARRAGAVLAVALLLLLGGLTWRQCRAYRDDQTLYRATLEQNPDAWLAHLNLGSLLLKQGRAAEAVAEYRAAERLEPDYPSTHFDLGMVELNSGDPAAARAEFERVLQIAPNDAEAHNNLGIALAQLGRVEEAMAQFQAATRLRPGYARAHSNLGSALFGLGRAVEAAAQYQAAIASEPGLAELHCNLGLALLKLGRRDEAREQFGQALRLRPDYPEAREAWARLGPAAAGSPP